MTRTWDLAVTFLLDNLHSDNPQFRHQLSSNLKKLLVRVLENSLSLIKTKQFNVSNVDPQLKSNIDNIQQLHDSLIQNLFTGASYQRKVGTLGALLYIFQLFTTNDGAAAASLAKGANIDKRHLLIQVASANSKWNWSDYQSMQRYAGNIFFCCVYSGILQGSSANVRDCWKFFETFGFNFLTILKKKNTWHQNSFHL